jgi:hypothetical protein
MKKYLFIAVAICFSIYLFGCGKKEAAVEESQEPMTMEALSTMPSVSPVATETKAPETTAAMPQTVTQPTMKLEPLPPAGPYKPAIKEIQTALKNAGLYTGQIDGKIGPMTKRAIEQFQKANNLQVDGKVGPKTWAALSKYLSPVPLAREQKR